MNFPKFREAGLVATRVDAAGLRGYKTLKHQNKSHAMRKCRLEAAHEARGRLGANRRISL